MFDVVLNASEIQDVPQFLETVQYQDIAKYPQTPDINLRYKFGRRTLGKKTWHSIQWTICYGGVCSEYRFCDKYVIADWTEAKEQNYIYKTDVNLYVTRYRL